MEDKNFNKLVNDIKKLVETRPDLSDTEKVGKWLDQFKNYTSVGQTKAGDTIYIDIKKTFNEYIAPIKEAMKIIEAYSIEATLETNDGQLSIFDKL